MMVNVFNLRYQQQSLHDTVPYLMVMVILFRQHQQHQNTSNQHPIQFLLVAQFHLYLSQQLVRHHIQFKFQLMTIQ